MEPNQTQAPEPGAEGTANGAPATAGQQATDWQTKAQEWQNRYAGLQGKFQQEQAKWAETAHKLQTVTEQLQATVGEKEGLAAQLASLNEAHGTTQTELATLKAKQARTSLIMAEYPDLLELETKGLLPDGNGDDLKGKLTTLRETLKARGAEAVTKTVQGSTPPPPTPTGNKTADDLRAAMFTALSQGNMAEYNQLYDQLVQAKRTSK